MLKQIIRNKITWIATSLAALQGLYHIYFVGSKYDPFLLFEVDPAVRIAILTAVNAFIAFAIGKQGFESEEQVELRNFRKQVKHELEELKPRAEETFKLYKDVYSFADDSEKYLFNSIKNDLKKCKSELLKFKIDCSMSFSDLQRLRSKLDSIKETLRVSVENLNVLTGGI